MKKVISVMRGPMCLVVQNLSAKRGENLIFSNIQFSVRKGEMLTVKGANGSGKTTLLRIIAGLGQAFKGSVTFSGKKSPDSICDVAHYLGHQNAMKSPLTVFQNLEFWQKFNGSVWKTIDEALTFFELETVSHMPFCYLSAGQKRRVALARLLLNLRPLWLLDEPETCLDQNSRMRVKDLLETQLAQGGIIIAATHGCLGLEPASILQF